MAALLVGLFWGGVWHLYGDYIGGLGSRGWWSIPLILVQAPVLLTAAAVLLGWLYNRTNGSLLLCVLFHASISSSSLLLSVTYPSSVSYFVWAMIGVLLWWATVCAVLLLDRRWWASPAPQQDKRISASPPAHPLAPAG